MPFLRCSGVPGHGTVPAALLSLFSSIITVDHIIPAAAFKAPRKLTPELIMSSFPESLCAVADTVPHNRIHSDEHNLPLPALVPSFHSATCKVISTYFPWCDSVARFQHMIRFPCCLCYWWESCPSAAWSRLWRAELCWLVSCSERAGSPEGLCHTSASLPWPGGFLQSAVPRYAGSMREGGAQVCVHLFYAEAAGVGGSRIGFLSVLILLSWLVKSRGDCVLGSRCGME